MSTEAAPYRDRLTDADIVRFKESLTPVSNEPWGHWVIQGNRIAAAQRVKSINLASLDRKVKDPTKKAPHEVFFYAGRDVHRLMSTRAMPQALAHTEAIASEQGIALKPPVGDAPAEWLHVVTNREGQLVAVEELGLAQLDDVSFREGEPLDDHEIQNLTVIYYEGMAG